MILTFEVEEDNLINKDQFLIVMKLVSTLMHSCLELYSEKLNV